MVIISESSVTSENNNSPQHSIYAYIILPYTDMKRHALNNVNTSKAFIKNYIVQIRYTHTIIANVS